MTVHPITQQFLRPSFSSLQTKHLGPKSRLSCSSCGLTSEGIAQSPIAHLSHAYNKRNNTGFRRVIGLILVVSIISLSLFLSPELYLALHHPLITLPLGTSEPSSTKCASFGYVTSQPLYPAAELCLSSCAALTYLFPGRHDQAREVTAWLSFEDNAFENCFHLVEENANLLTQAMLQESYVSKKF